MGEQRYYPYGETRFTSGTIYTDKLFTRWVEPVETGQREITGLGIYHYEARFYSPKIGRFLSADTLIPSYINPQHLNRYMYVVGNPIRYNDPTGHAEPSPDDGGCYPCTPPTPPPPPPSPRPPRQPAPLPPQDPDPVPPVVDLPPVVIILPPVDLGPIVTSPNPFPETEPAYCIAFKNRKKTIVAQARAIFEEIMALRKELENPKLDWITRKAIEQRLINLRSQLTDLRQALEVLEDLAKAAGCNI